MLCPVSQSVNFLLLNVGACDLHATSADCMSAYSLTSVKVLPTVSGPSAVVSLQQFLDLPRLCSETLCNILKQISIGHSNHGTV